MNRRFGHFDKATRIFCRSVNSFQVGAGASDPRPHRTYSNSESDRCFGVTQLFECHQDERFPDSSTELHQLIYELTHLAFVVELIRDAVCVIRLGARRRQPIQCGVVPPS
ncbi:hypothetical protein FRACA_1500003 [Frankia canadensis]|uniref:Uncharacterized protein n=1 Tax=Frankia canadensis TaxID=1836972 RepID=A0A2I2KM05_9ACTN|nr:hypothetical protein FRACA_1500003 [Frankia canadensis]SOU53983.1 hypothetical protein FRACA_1500003 [Frankia canadensis]